MAHISEYLAANLSADASADALCIINIGNLINRKTIIKKINFTIQSNNRGSR